MKEHEFEVSKLLHLGGAETGTDREWKTTSSPQEVVDLVGEGWELVGGVCEEDPCCEICNQLFAALENEEQQEGGKMLKIWQEVAECLGWEVPTEIDENYARNLCGEGGYLDLAYAKHGVDGLKEFFMRPVWAAQGNKERIFASVTLTALGEPEEKVWLTKEQEEFISSRLFAEYPNWEAVWEIKRYSQRNRS